MEGLLNGFNNGRDTTDGIGGKNMLNNYHWKREGSFLDQIKDVWKCYYNNSDHYCARITVNTINECRITILERQHHSINGIDRAKAYVEAILNER